MELVKNALSNLIGWEVDTDGTYLCDKDLNTRKYELLTKKHKNVGIKHFSDSKAFIVY